MTIGLRWGEDSQADGGFIWFDAVTAYTRNFRGSVTKHPIDGGGNVTDHFIRDNPTVTLSAVITGIDISTGSYLIQDLVGNSPYNVNEAPTPVSVNSTDQSLLQKLLPASASQFLSDATPDITVDAPRTNNLDQIQQFMIELMSGVIYDDKTGKFNPNIQLVRLFEYDKSFLRKVINNLVITNIVFKETASTGQGLYCDITFEQVTFAFSKKTTIPKDVLDALKKKSADNSSKGKQDSKTQSLPTGDKPPDVSPRRKANADLKKIQ